jgi:hypothetical protein
MNHGKSFYKIVFAGFRWTELRAKKYPLMTRPVMKAQCELFKAKLDLPGTKFETHDEAQTCWNNLTKHQKKWSYISEITPVYGIL